MSLTYPPFLAKEYGFLNPSLHIIDFAHNLLDLEARLYATTVKRDRLVSESSQTEYHAMASILDEASKVAGTEKDRDLRQVALKNCLSSYKRTLGKPYIDISLRQRRDTVLSTLLRLYGMFDDETFRGDIAELYGTDEENYRSQLDGCKIQIGKLQKAIATLWPTYPKCFKTVPTRFKDFAIYEDRDRDQENQRMAEIVIRAFVDDWKSRCQLFEVPVTVTGVAIHTLPSDQQKKWRRGWELFGLDKLPHRQRFVPYMVKQKEPKPSSSPPSLLPVEA